MVKSVERKGVTLWCFSWQVEERSKTDNEERRRSREAEGVTEASREVSKTDGRRVGNREEEEAANSERAMRWDDRLYVKRDIKM